MPPAPRTASTPRSASMATSPVSGDRSRSAIRQLSSLPVASCPTGRATSTRPRSTITSTWSPGASRAASCVSMKTPAPSTRRSAMTNASVCRRLCKCSPTARCSLRFRSDPAARARRSCGSITTAAATHLSPRHFSTGSFGLSRCRLTVMCSSGPSTTWRATHRRAHWSRAKGRSFGYWALMVRKMADFRQSC